MSRAAVAACVLSLTLITACGGDDDDVVSAGEALIGNWVLEANDGSACAFLFTFGADRKYEYGQACALDDGQVGYDSTVGEYKLEDSRVGLTPTHATCEDVDTDTGWLAFTFLDSERARLRIVNESGALVLVRHEDDGMGGGSASIVFGCFDGSLFEPHKLTAL